ncbi:MAG: diaminopimelate epimerase [Anaerolineae bacterium]
MRFFKYHALGNDYIVLDVQGWPAELDAGTIRRICDRHRGIGSDGILRGAVDEDGALALRIFNPDGSEAEKSGNGIRIYARYLWDTGRVTTEPFDLDTRGGRVRCEVLDNGGQVRVEMGRVSFDAAQIPVAGMAGEVLNRTIEVGAQTLTFCAATVGNPHCIILCDQISSELAHALGPLLEGHAYFPHRTNVQFLCVIDDAHIAIEIWERGAGYTLASGTSSVAAAAVAHRLGRCGNLIDVAMPGGHLSVAFGADFQATLTGPVTPVFDGVTRDDWLVDWRD